MTDEDMQQVIADTAELEKLVLAEEYTAAHTAARNAASPRESARMLGLLIDDICANDYYKARRIGITDAQIDKMRDDTDKYLADIEAWERRQNANMIPAVAPPAGKAADDPNDLVDKLEMLRILQAFSDINITAFKDAHASGDE